MFLFKKIQKWVDSGLISPEQSELIKNFEKNKNQKIFLLSTLGLAGFLIGLGICLVVASNWNNLHYLIKLLLNFSILGTFIYFLYWSIINDKNNLKELFIILTFLTIGSSFGLLGQIFNLKGDWHSLCLVWSITTIPLLLFTKSNFFNFLWISIFCSLFNNNFLEILIDLSSKNVFISSLIISLLALSSYGFKKLYYFLDKIILLPKTLSVFLIPVSYFLVFINGLYFNLEETSIINFIFSNIFVFSFVGFYSFLSIKNQDLNNFRKNIYFLEFYIFILFLSKFNNLFVSGFSFILLGLVILSIIYVYKKTPKFINNLKFFKNEKR